MTVYHNIARDEHGRPVGFTGYRPGQPLVPVFRYDVEPQDSHDGLHRVAEEAFKMFNLDVHMLAGRMRDLAAQYRESRLRSLSVGDVVRIGDTALSCEPAGFRKVSGALHEVTACVPDRSEVGASSVGGRRR